MKLTTKGRYGLKAAYILAEQYGHGPIPIKQISERENISDSYLEQLLARMRKSDLVESVRGVQGGYQLKRSPSEITVGDILRSVEGDLNPTDCIDSAEAHCENVFRCPSRRVWLKLKKGIDDVVDSITLQDMILEEDKESE